MSRMSNRPTSTHDNKEKQAIIRVIGDLHRYYWDKNKKKIGLCRIFDWWPAVHRRAKNKRERPIIVITGTKKWWTQFPATKYPYIPPFLLLAPKSKIDELEHKNSQRQIPHLNFTKKKKNCKEAISCVARANYRMWVGGCPLSINVQTVGARILRAYTPNAPDSHILIQFTFFLHIFYDPVYLCCRVITFGTKRAKRPTTCMLSTGLQHCETCGYEKRVIAFLSFRPILCCTLFVPFAQK